MIKILNYIDGAMVGPHNGNYIDNYNPAEGKVYSAVPDSDEHDVDAAVEAARQAYSQWSVMPVEKRSGLLQHLADLTERDLEKRDGHEIIISKLASHAAERSFSCPPRLHVLANAGFFCRPGEQVREERQL